MSGDDTSNITQTLTNLFEEMLLETEMTGENRTNVDFSQFLSALREQTTKNSSNESLDFGALVKLVDGWRTRLNLTRSSEPACTYCEGNFRDVILAYNSIHGYLSLIVCFFGSLANALNVAVLTRRDLAAAPINRLLKWLAVADVFVMLEYVPFAIYKYLILPGQREMPYKWAAYLLFHMHFAQIFHTASICLTLSLAVWRYVAIKYSDKNHILCTERRCSTAILSSFILPPILCIPTYMVFDIHTAIVLEPSGLMILYHVDSDEEGQLYQINFWVHAVVIKLLPCLILTVISLWLIREVYSANQHQKKIRVYNKCPTNNKAVKRQYKADRRTNRTTKMLVAVLLLFLVTELPQGILGLLSGLLGRCFFKRCYDLFGELMDALALLNGAINFVLYCSMSRQFRMTFGQMMWRAHLHRWPPPTGSQSDGQNTSKMKLLIVLALVAVVAARPDDEFYDKKYDDFNVDEIIENVRLLKAYAHCIIGDGKCTPEGNDFKRWVPEATKSSCGKCTEKQKVLVAKTIKAIKEKCPEEYATLIKQLDPENKYADDLKNYLAKYGH